MSVAWDWVFTGVTQAGWSEEIGYALKCANDNRLAGADSLAPMETCLLQVKQACVVCYAAVLYRTFKKRTRSSR